MQRPTGKVLRGVFNALMLGALGVGASQALAAPASPAVSYGCSPWQQSACTDWCRSMHPYNPNVVGECTSFDRSGYYDCTCAVVLEEQP